MTSETPSPTPGWFRSLLVATVLALPILVALGLQPLTWPRYWWHITIGAFISTWETIPDGQLFLFSLPTESPWIYPTWAGDLLLSLAHSLAGADFSLLLRNLIAFGSALLFLFPLVRRGTPAPLLALIAALLTIGLFLFLPLEPLFLTLPFLALITLSLRSLLLRPSAFWLALPLPIAIALVANLHLGAALLLSLSSWILLLSLFRGPEAPWSTLFLLAIAPLGLFSFVYGPAALPAAALDALREFRLWAIFALFPAALLLEKLLASPPSLHPPERFPLFLFLPALLVLGAIAIVVQPGIPLRQNIMHQLYSDLRQTPPLAGSLPTEIPLRCAEELRRTGRTLRLYTDPVYSSFLLHHLYDPRQIEPLLFHDHRPLLPADRRDLPELLKTEPIARGIFAAERINAVVVPRQHYPALIDDLRLDRRWTDLNEHLDTPYTCFLITAAR